MTDCEKAEQFVCISCVEEVRYSFVSHLSGALRRKGINDVVVDVDSDNPLSKELLEKIEKARVSVMVLPGDSEPTRVCLNNFGMVRDCHKNKDQVVVPVLYGDIPLQEEWFGALYLGVFSPIHQSRKECSDSKLVEEIVRDVYEKLFYMEQIGIYSKLLEIEKMVSKQPLGIRRVGIWGMPGIGKTTLAKAVFDQMSGDFDACCFIEDYDKTIHEKGLYRLLEEHFLKEMPGADHGTITALSFLRNKLNKKRVLVVLDNVHNALVAESFLEGFEWWGPESLIIITSRDKQVFSLCRINQVYEVQGLNEKDALQLFLLCASIKDIDEQILHKPSMEVIKYADGNPLALTIYGRELKGQRDPSDMMIAFLKLKQCPPFEIVDAIKGSYDTLSNSEKNIFLDIACFFPGDNADYVLQLLEGCGFFPHVGIDVLVEKCLVTISENRIQMHNLIQEFGRKFINGDTAQIEWRSRLWEPWRIKCLLEDDGEKANGEIYLYNTTFTRAQVPEEIEGMFLDTSNLSFDIKPTAFLNMLNLRLLKIYCSNSEIHPVINFSKGFLHSLPNELRLLHWENYPLQYLPQNFDPKHLVEINMPYSQLQKLWGGTKNLEMLRTIRLCHSQQLFDIDDLLNAQNLEVIDLQGCTRLQSFPATGQLLHLRVVNLSGCTEIKILPAIPPNIEMLHLQGTGIIELPLSIVKPNYRELLNLLAEIPGLSGVSDLEQSDLKSLTSLMKMSSSNQDLGKLICLDLKDCSRLRSLPDMVSLELLRVLDLSGCSELETIQGFPRNLKELYLADTAVREVPQLPQSLELFNAHGCASLKSTRLDFEKLPVHYTFSNCFDLSPQVVNDFLMKALANAKHIPRERQQELNEALAFSFCGPSPPNQNSALDLQPGSSVVTRLNPSWRNTLVGFAMLVEVAFSEDYCDATGFGIRCVCRWKNNEGHSQRIERNLQCWAPGKAVPKVQKDHIFVFVDVNMRPSTDEGNDPDIWADLVVFEFFPVNKQTKPLDDSCTVTRCGVRVINAATGNTSLGDISPVLSLDPMEVSGNKVERVLRVSYDGLLEMNKVLFLYIACLFNDEYGDLVAPLIASNIELDVSSGLKVLADRSLIRVSSNGEIGMHCLLQKMGKEILHTKSILPRSSKRYEKLVDSYVPKNSEGGRRCEFFLGCTKSAEGRTDFCISHGGGRRCSHEDCTRAARGRSGLCIRHGGGKICQRENCTKSAEGLIGLCISHGGGRRCQSDGCTKGAQGSTMFCKAHGGGKRCTHSGCTKGAEGSTAFCKGHRGGKRWAFQGGDPCSKSVHGGTNFSVAHGGGKRCAVPECTKSAIGRTDFCVRHGGGKRCKFEGCGKSAQGSTDFCKAHGGGKRCAWGHPETEFAGHSSSGPCTSFARGKTGLCALHNSLVQDNRVHGGMTVTSESQELRLSSETENEEEFSGSQDMNVDAMKARSDSGSPETDVDLSEYAGLGLAPEGRVHGGSLMMAMLARDGGSGSSNGQERPKRWM